MYCRNTRFGKTGTRFINPAFNPEENFSFKILTILSLSYTPKSWLTFTAGANNIFDVYPDRIQDARTHRKEGIFIAWRQRYLAFMEEIIFWDSV